VSCELWIVIDGCLQKSTNYILITSLYELGFSGEMYSLVPLRMADIIALHRVSLLGEVSMLDH
jgi:hypothetical protein